MGTVAGRFRPYPLAVSTLPSPDYGAQPNVRFPSVRTLAAQVRFPPIADIERLGLLLSGLVQSGAAPDYDFGFFFFANGSTFIFLPVFSQPTIVWPRSLRQPAMMA